VYRIPTDLDLKSLCGLTVVQVALGEHEVIINLHPEGSITLLGGWSLNSRSGAVIDRSMENAKRETSSIHKILGMKIRGWRVKDDRHLSLSIGEFDLEIEDSSDQYESFSISHGELSLIV
jgi:hypothetical protein